MPSLATLAASVFEISSGKTNRQTLVKTVPSATSVDVGNDVVSRLISPSHNNVDPSFAT